MKKENNVEKKENNDVKHKTSGKEKVIVTKDSNLAQVVYKYPQSEEILLDYGLHCVGCIASAYDSIEAGAKVHGLSDKEISEMVDRINEVINFGE